MLFDQSLFFLELHLHDLYLLLLELKRVQLILLQLGVRNTSICLRESEILGMHYLGLG